MTTQELQKQVNRADRARWGDSNDEEIEALWSALELALEKWPEITREPDPEDDDL